MTKNNNGSNHGVNTRLAHSGYSPRDFHGFVNPPRTYALQVSYRW